MTTQGDPGQLEISVYFRSILIPLTIQSMNQKLSTIELSRRHENMA